MKPYNDWDTIQKFKIIVTKNCHEKDNTSTRYPAKKGVTKIK